MKKLFLLIFTTLILASCSQEENRSEQPLENNNNQEVNNTQNDEGNNEQDVNDTQNDEGKNEQDVNDTPNGEAKSLTKSDSEQILIQYKDTFMNIVEKTDENGKVTDYDSKEELISHFTTIMSMDLAEWFAETYFREENDQLFLKAMDAPTWFVNDKPYTLEKINEQEYNVIQERNNELLGHVNMIYKLSYQGKKWIVSDIDLDRLDTNNGTSEATFTEKEAVATVR